MAQGIGLRVRGSLFGSDKAARKMFFLATGRGLLAKASVQQLKAKK